MLSGEDKQAIQEAVSQIAEVIKAQRGTDRTPWPDLVQQEIQTEAAGLLDAERVAISNGDPAERPATDVELTQVARDRVIERLKQSV